MLSEDWFLKQRFSNFVIIAYTRPHKIMSAKNHTHDRYYDVYVNRAKFLNMRDSNLKELKNMC